MRDLLLKGKRRKYETEGLQNRRISLMIPLAHFEHIFILSVEK